MRVLQQPQLLQQLRQLRQLRPVSDRERLMFLYLYELSSVCFFQLSVAQFLVQQHTLQVVKVANPLSIHLTILQMIITAHTTLFQSTIHNTFRLDTTDVVMLFNSFQINHSI
jgi:hypothetical protein